MHAQYTVTKTGWASAEIEGERTGAPLQLLSFVHRQLFFELRLLLKELYLVLAKNC